MYFPVVHVATTSPRRLAARDGYMWKAGRVRAEIMRGREKGLPAAADAA